MSAIQKCIYCPYFGRLDFSMVQSGKMSIEQYYQKRISNKCPKCSRPDFHHQCPLCLDWVNGKNYGCHLVNCKKTEKMSMFYLHISKTYVFLEFVSAPHSHDLEMATLIAQGIPIEIFLNREPNSLTFQLLQTSSPVNFQKNELENHLQYSSSPEKETQDLSVQSEKDKLISLVFKNERMKNDHSYSHVVFGYFISQMAQRCPDMFYSYLKSKGVSF